MSEEAQEERRQEDDHQYHGNDGDQRARGELPAGVVADIARRLRQVIVGVVEAVRVPLLLLVLVLLRFVFPAFSFHLAPGPKAEPKLHPHQHNTRRYMNS